MTHIIEEEEEEKGELQLGVSKTALWVSEFGNMHI
jgi:hypothetical protein